MLQYSLSKKFKKDIGCSLYLLKISSKKTNFSGEALVSINPIIT
ncbi:MAG: hypothetical protein K0S24_574 [Sphingobacterium sp.]|jgi:hypothetical protein|nr:hypothetical protein [Sphingobacterium sp.]